MKANEILELVRAGYTKSEILSFEGMTGETKTEEAKTEEAVKETVQNDQTAKNAESENETLKTLNAKITELTNTIKEIQSMNVKAADSGQPKKETSEDAIRDFFGMKKGGK